MTYQNYEWTAFKESDLLTGGDRNINTGDVFVMPVAATTVLSVSDDDTQLSGDNNSNERSDLSTDSQQAFVDGEK